MELQRFNEERVCPFEQLARVFEVSPKHQTPTTRSLAVLSRSFSRLKNVASRLEYSCSS